MDETETHPYVLIDQPDDGYPEQWAWVAVTAADTEEAAVKLLALECGVPDESRYEVRGRVTLAPEVQPDGYEEWFLLGVDGDQERAAEFWKVEVVDAS